MKILHIIPSLHIGGAEKILFEICSGTRDQISHVVLALKGGGFTEEQLKKLDIPVTILNTPEDLLLGAFAFPALLFSLRSKMSEIKPDIVHTWLCRANVAGRLAAIGKNIKVISSIRVEECGKAYHLWAERMTSIFASKVTVNSHALRDFAISRLRITGKKIILIPNGIRAESAPNVGIGKKIQEKWFLPQKLHIGVVARLHFQKGIDVLLNAAQIVLKEQANCKFLIAGDGPEKKNLQILARKLKIEDNIEFCGWVNHPLEFISLLNIFVLPSRWEGCPNVILEAMSLRKPIVATAVGGTTDLIENRKDGLLFPSENVKSCAASILELLRNPSLQEQLASHAQERVLRQFSVITMLKSYERLYALLNG